MFLYVMSLHLVWGTRALPENPQRPPPWAHVADTSIPLSGRAGHGASVLATTSSSFPLQLPVSRPDPSFAVKSKPQCLALSGPQQADGWAAVAGAGIPHSGPLSWDAPSLSQVPLLLRARTSPLPLPSLLARSQACKWEPGACKELNHPKEPGKATTKKLSVWGAPAMSVRL